MTRLISFLPLLLLILIIAISLFAPILAPHDPLDAVTGQELKPPSSIYPLGTDLIGRDVYSRVLYGGRRTLSVAALALMLSILPGLLIGLIAGYSGGTVDHTIGAVLEALLAFPGLLLALVVIAIAGSGPLQIALAVGLSGIAPYAKVARAATRQILTQPYIEAARAIGVPSHRILSRYILPNIAQPMIAFATVTLSWAIMNAATLHFLGFGGDSSTPEWGAMLADGRTIFPVAPWAALAPGVAIMITLLAVTLVAEAIGR